VSRLRRREIIPEDTAVIAVISAPKLVFGKFGRQVETTVRVVDGTYRGTEFKNWFAFGRDKDTEEEFISYGGPLYQLLIMVAPNLDAVLEDEDLTDRAYEKFLKESVAKLEGLKIVARVGVKVPKDNPEKKRNTLESGTFGLHKDLDKEFEAIDMGDDSKSKAKTQAEEQPAPF
jgi:hypothetical protein